jgi:hypothetical protein
VLRPRLARFTQGYLEAQGKFEGDDFEPLFVKVNTDAALLQVLIAQGLPVEFDLSSKAFVFEDSADPTSIILDYRGNIVVFKVSEMLLFSAPGLSCLRLQLALCGHDFFPRPRLVCCDTSFPLL